MLITASKTMTFFATEAAAAKIAEANGGEAEGFRVIPSPGRPGKFLVEVFDTSDGYVLGPL